LKKEGGSHEPSHFIHHFAFADHRPRSPGERPQSDGTASKLSCVDSQALTKTQQQKLLTKSCHNSDKIIVLDSEPLVSQLLTANTVSLRAFPYI
jgi:hypothetical protein